MIGVAAPSTQHNIGKRYGAITLETRISMVLPGIVDQWNYWTDECDPQEFMNLGRIQGHPTIGSAVDAYVVEIPGLDRAWAGLNAEELEGIRDVLMSYLFLTRSEEWT